MGTKTLTISGLGIEIESEEFLKTDPQKHRKTLKEKGAMLVRNLNCDLENMTDIVASFGELIGYTSSQSVATTNSNILTLDGENEDISYGRYELPLHADGYMFKKQIDHIFLYGLESIKVKFQGATSICDHSTAYKEMPLHLKNVLDEEILETRIIEKWFKRGVDEPEWVEVPVFSDLGWCRKMIIYLPFQEGDLASWETRVKGFSPKENTLFFNELRNFLQQHRYYYKHHWRKGDLLIIDNRRILHGRKQFDEDGKRKLYRWQTKETSPKIA